MKKLRILNIILFSIACFMLILTSIGIAGLYSTYGSEALTYGKTSDILFLIGTMVLGYNSFSDKNKHLGLFTIMGLVLFLLFIII